MIGTCRIYPYGPKPIAFPAFCNGSSQEPRFLTGAHIHDARHAAVQISGSKRSKKVSALDVTLTGIV
jgi:hypothetical protein